MSAPPSSVKAAPNGGFENARSDGNDSVPYEGGGSPACERSGVSPERTAVNVCFGTPCPSAEGRALPTTRRDGLSESCHPELRTRLRQHMSGFVRYCAIPTRHPSRCTRQQMEIRKDEITDGHSFAPTDFISSGHDHERDDFGDIDPGAFVGAVPSAADAGAH